jgi:hypothetical protein
MFVVKQVVNQRLPLYNWTNSSNGNIIYQNIDTLDSDLSNNYYAQKQMTEWLRHRILDKWLFRKEMEELLKYLRIVDDKVVVVKDESEIKNYNLDNETTKMIEKKADFLGDILTPSKLRNLVIKIVKELRIKWYDFTDIEYEKIVVKTAKKYLKRKLMQK